MCPLQYLENSKNYLLFIWNSSLTGCLEFYLGIVCGVDTREWLVYQLFSLLLVPQCTSSVQFSRSVMSDCLQPHELQHTRPPCPSPTSGVHSDSRPSSQWCHPAISSSVVPFSSCPQSLPASQSFPMSQLFLRWPKSWSFSFSIIPSKEHPGLISFRMDWLNLLSIQGSSQHRSSQVHKSHT